MARKAIPHLLMALLLITGLFGPGCARLKDRNPTKIEDRAPADLAPDALEEGEFLRVVQSTKARLDSGLTVVLGRIADGPQAQILLSLPAGQASVNEDNLWAPLWAAHTALSSAQAAALMALGGEFNREVGADHTQFILTVPHERALDGVAFMVDFIMDEKITLRQAPYRARIPSDREEALGLFRQRLLAHGGYGASLLDPPAGENPPWMDFRKRHYLPDGAYLSVISPQEVLAMAEVRKILAPWQGLRVMGPVKAQLPIQWEGLATVDRADFEAPLLVFGREALRRSARDFIPSMLATTLMMGHPQARLQRALRDAGLGEFEISGGLTGFLQTSAVEIVMPLPPEKAAQIMPVIQSFLESAQTIPPTSEEVWMAGHVMRGELRREADDLRAISLDLMAQEETQLGSRALEARLRTLTVEELQKTLRGLFRPSAFSYVLIGSGQSSQNP